LFLKCLGVLQEDVIEAEIMSSTCEYSCRYTSYHSQAPCFCPVSVSLSAKHCPPLSDP